MPCIPKKYGPEEFGAKFLILFYGSPWNYNWHKNGIDVIWDNGSWFPTLFLVQLP